MKRNFRDIDSTEEGKHIDTTGFRFNEAGKFIHSNLRAYKSSVPPSNYEDSGKQGINSFEGHRPKRSEFPLPHSFSYANFISLLPNYFLGG